MTKRNGEIDILRFIFATIIVIFHYGLIWHISLGKNGNFGVDFFFLLSGFLMAKSTTKILFSKTNNTNIFLIVIKFIIKKAQTFYKYFIALLIISYPIYATIQHWNLKIWGQRLIESVPYLLFIDMLGIQTKANIMLGVTWYLSVMMISISLLLPILLLNYKKAQKIILPTISIIIFGYLYGKYHRITGGTTQWLGFTYFATLRGIAEMALGSTCYEISKVLSNTKLTPLQKMILTIIKITCFTIAITYALSAANTSYSLGSMILLTIGIIISFSNTSYTLQQNKLTTWFAKISLPIYLFHQTVRTIQIYILGNHLSTSMVFCLIIQALIISICIMYIVDYTAKTIHKTFN